MTIWWYTHVYFGHNIEKNTEEQLRISETAFRGNFENAAIGMAFIDMDIKLMLAYVIC
jgi:hypothetical protein